MTMIFILMFCAADDGDISTLNAAGPECEVLSAHRYFDSSFNAGLRFCQSKQERDGDTMDDCIQHLWAIETPLRP